MTQGNSSGEGLPPESEDQKPQSDEAHSAFTPPLGVPLPPPLPPPPEGSAFAHPGAPAPPSPAPPPTPPPPAPTSSFTPSSGVPVVRLRGPWQDTVRTLLRSQQPAERAIPEHSTQAENAPSVPRVLDLTLRLGELLLAGGEGAEDVEAAMYAVTHAYGLERCEPNVTFTLLSVSYQPSLVDHPVGLSRVVRRRGTDYTRLAAVFRLVDDIASQDLTLEEAYRRLADIRRNRHPYPGWLLSVASGVLAGSASVLVGGGALVFVAALLAAILGDRLAWLLSGRGLPEFYQFVVAAMPAAGAGVALQFFGAEVRGSAVITGGLFALFPGRPLVAAVHDGLTGFYITASARLLEVGYLVVAIVCGVLLVLYLGVSVGVELSPEQALVSVERPAVQLAAAMVLTLAFAVLLQTERNTLLLVTLNGAVAWTIYGALHDHAGVSPVLSTLVAAGLVGLYGQLLSRYRYASLLPYVTAAVGPLLPGGAIYLGLLSFAEGHLDNGWTQLSKAAALALAIAVGVNLGGEVARLFLRVPVSEDPTARRAAKRTRGF